MTGVTRRLWLLILTLLPFAGCGPAEERQWYKLNANYSVAEFQRDRTERTKNWGLDEDLRQRGWVPLSTERQGPVKTPPPRGRGY